MLSTLRSDMSAAVWSEVVVGYEEREDLTKSGVSELGMPDVAPTPGRTGRHRCPFVGSFF